MVSYSHKQYSHSHKQYSRLGRKPSRELNWFVQEELDDSLIENDEKRLEQALWDEIVGRGDWSEDGMGRMLMSAVTSGHQHIGDWLLEQGAKWPSGAIHTAACSYRMEFSVTPRFAMVQWMRERGAPWESGGCCYLQKETSSWTCSSHFCENCRSNTEEPAMYKWAHAQEGYLCSCSDQE